MRSEPGASTWSSAVAVLPARVIRKWSARLVLVLFVGVTAAGAAYVASSSRAPVYEARSTVVLQPAGSISSEGDVVQALTALDRSRLAPTFADIVSSPGVIDQAGMRAGLVTSDDYKVQARLLAESLAIEVSVQGPGRAETVALTSRLLEVAGGRFDSAYRVYEAAPLESPRGLADPIAPKPLQDAVVGLVVGIGVAIALIAAVNRLRRGPRQPEHPPGAYAVFPGSPGFPGPAFRSITGFVLGDDHVRPTGAADSDDAAAGSAAGAGSDGPVGSSGAVGSNGAVGSKDVGSNGAAAPDGPGDREEDAAPVGSTATAGAMTSERGFGPGDVSAPRKVANQHSHRRDNSANRWTRKWSTRVR